MILIAPPDIIYDSVKINRSEDGRTARISWTVLSLDVVRGYIQLRIEFPSSNRKRQAGTTECSVSGCLVPYEQGGVNVTGLEPDQDVTFSISAQNEEGETATVTLTHTLSRMSQYHVHVHVATEKINYYASVINVIFFPGLVNFLLSALTYKVSVPSCLASK